MTFFSGDDQFAELKAVFKATGRGRHPDLPTVLPTNHLLLQILTLMEDGGKSYDDAASFLRKLFPDPQVQTFPHYLSQATKQWEKKTLRWNNRVSPMFPTPIGSQAHWISGSLDPSLKPKSNRPVIKP